LLQVKKSLLTTPNFVDDCSAGVYKAVLGKITDCQSVRLDDTSRIGVLGTGHHLEQCGFASTVRSAEADTIART
jgi:hypothetical protein